MRVITQTKLTRPGRYDYHYFVEVTAGRWREFWREDTRLGDQANYPSREEATHLAAESAAAGHHGTIPTAKLIGFTAGPRLYN